MESTPLSQLPAALAESAKPAESAGAWRTGLLMAGSALLGGIAVVLWNRRILGELRAESPEPAAPATDIED